MKSSRALCVLFLSAYASSAFAIDFCKVPGLQGESKDPAHAGWIELKTWNWENANPAAKGPKCGATNQAAFATTGSSPHAEAELMRMCELHQALPQLTIDAGGERHVLNQISFVSCKKDSFSGPVTTYGFGIRYHDCSTHIAPIPAQIVGETVPSQMVKLVLLRFVGKGGTIILQSDFGGGGSSFFTQAYTSKQTTPHVSIKANNQTWTFSDMVVPGYQATPDGKQTFTFGFSSMTGPPGGYQRP